MSRTIYSIHRSELRRPAAVSPVQSGRARPAADFSLYIIKFIDFTFPEPSQHLNTLKPCSMLYCVLSEYFRRTYDPPGDKCSELLALHGFRTELEPSMTMCSLAAYYGSLRKMR
jgi:hypothetical protein